MECFEEQETFGTSYNQPHVRKVKKNQKKPSLEAIHVTIEKKKQCTAKALDIVVRFSEETISENLLIENLQFINQEHYQDIVEERAINKLCGYPPCAGLLQNVPMKKYHISTSHNKVFDITDRKNFCSNMCYKASKYLKDQILTSPLWLRENVSAVTYKLISLNSQGGSVGDEVDLGFSQVKVEDEDTVSSNIAENSNENNSLNILESKESVSCNNTMNAPNLSERTTISIPPPRGSDNGDPDIESGLQIEEPKQDSIIKTGILFPDSLNKNESGDIISINSKPMLNSSYYQTECNKIDKRMDEELNNVSINITSETQKEVHNVSNESIEKRKEKKISLKQQNSSKKQYNHGSLMQTVVRKIEETLREWFSVDSFCLIFGEEKLREMLTEKNNSITEFSNLTNRTMDPHVYEKYMAICKKLKILEIEDTKTDMAFREDPKRPLPDYDALKHEARELDLKVKLFYKGDKIVQFEEPDRDASYSTNDTSNNLQPVLPLVDLHAQKALRRRIVMDKIKRVLQDLQKSLCLRGFNLFEEFQILVSTFDLSSHNITMRPVEWNLITIFIIKLLSVKDNTLKQAINSNPTKKNLTLLLMSYSLDNGYLDRLIVWLSDIEYVLQKKS